MSTLNSCVYSNKADDITDLEDIQKRANERFITAQILSQSLDNVYRLFEVNLATSINDPKNQEADVEFINHLTDIFYTLQINLIEIKPIRPEKDGKYTLVPYEIEFTCDYEKFGKLITEFERSERLIRINEFSYANNPDNVRRIGKNNKLPDSVIKMEIASITLNKTSK